MFYFLIIAFFVSRLLLGILYIFLGKWDELLRLSNLNFYYFIIMTFYNPNPPPPPQKKKKQKKYGLSVSLSEAITVGGSKPRKTSFLLPPFTSFGTSIIHLWNPNFKTKVTHFSWKTYCELTLLSFCLLTSFWSWKFPLVDECNSCFFVI